MNWQSRDHFTILAAGFGSGKQFLETWQAWRDDPQGAARLTYVAVEAQPPTCEALRAAYPGNCQADDQLRELLAAWPPLTPNIHLLELEEGRLRLLLAVGDVAVMLGRVQVDADALVLTGRVTDALSAYEAPRVASALARRIRVGGTITVARASAKFAALLKAEGFVLHEAQTSTEGGASRELVGEFRPDFRPKRVPARRSVVRGVEPGPRTAMIIGSGIAGALAAQALARTGWTCTVLDRNADAAQETSGNPAGIFHGSAHVGDGVHARFARAAALLAAHRYAKLIEQGAVLGEVKGVLRLNPSAHLVQESHDGYLQAVDAFEASSLAACRVSGPAGWYPGGGWLAPATLCRHALNTPGIHWQGNANVHQLKANGERWLALDALGRPLAEASVVVCATGSRPLPIAGAGDYPLSRIRGQISWLDAKDIVGEQAGPLVPLTGHGYALRLPDGRLVFGASSQVEDADPTLRTEDDEFNRERLAALCGVSPAAGAPVQGRVGWRSTMLDRLPVVGAWPVDPAQQVPGWRGDHCRLVPRVPGLFVLLGLASRGLTWGPLAAEVLAAWINGTAMPLETDLLDAIDPARVQVRKVRRSPSLRPDR